MKITRNLVESEKVCRDDERFPFWNKRISLDIRWKPWNSLEIDEMCLIPFPNDFTTPKKKTLWPVIHLRRINSMETPHKNCYQSTSTAWMGIFGNLNMWGKGYSNERLQNISRLNHITAAVNKVIVYFDTTEQYSILFHRSIRSGKSTVETTIFIASTIRHILKHQTSNCDGTTIHFVSNFVGISSYCDTISAVRKKNNNKLINETKIAYIICV